MYPATGATIESNWTELIKLRQERVCVLADQNVISEKVLSQVQSELPDAEQRRP
jgi:hypothetical protein